jgi:release factor glutamine methyltransferase
MITIREALLGGRNALEESMSTLHGKEEARDLLAFVMEREVTDLLLHPNHPLSDAHLDRYIRLLNRRRRGEPLSHLLLERGFYGRSFFVNKHVLTPRPETELVIDLLLERGVRRLIDIGTGSGAIAITAERELGAEVLGTDIDAYALRIAKHNAKKLNSSARFAHATWYGNASVNGATIIANLPYLPKRDAETDSVHAYEPHHALYAGHDGLSAYHELLLSIHQEQTAPERLYMETYPAQADLLARLAAHYAPSAALEVHHDLAKKTRYLELIF